MGAPFEQQFRDAGMGETAPTLTLEPGQQAAAEDELADVLIYLTRLANVLVVDLLGASRDKLLRNASRFPVPVAGSSTVDSEGVPSGRSVFVFSDHEHRGR